VKFQPGDAVATVAQIAAGHTRLPCYLRAKPGIIESVHACFPLADEHAQGRRRLERLYTVAFDGCEVWDTEAEPGCVILADLWESYLVRP
jgi:nitrile hydratase